MLLEPLIIIINQYHGNQAWNSVQARVPKLTLASLSTVDEFYLNGFLKKIYFQAH